MPCGVEPRKLIDSNVVGWRQLRQIRGNASILLDPTNFICAPSASRDRADERAGDPLHGGRIDAKASGDLANAVAGILASFQSRTDAPLNVGRYARPTKRFAFADGPARTRSAMIARRQSLEIIEIATP